MLVISGIAGLWMLLYGMDLMRKGLEYSAKDKMESALLKMAGTPFKACITGFIATMLVQSSTAISVMSIGLVNARIMNLRQAIGILLGSNVGTCITVQIISFDIIYFALMAGFLGLLLTSLFKSKNLINFGRGLIGFGIIFSGLKIMAVSFEPLQHASWFINLLHSLSHSDVLAVIAGTLASALLHSSAAATGIVMLLSKQNLLPLTTAIAVVMGNNVGTCITAVLASIKGSAAGKRVALAHVLLNIVGVLLFLPLLTAFAWLIVLLSGDDISRQVANAHTLFNLISSMVAYPFIRYFAFILEKIVPESNKF